MSLQGEQLDLYNQLEASGHQANRAGNFSAGLDYFEQMDAVAATAEDPAARLKALNPAAKAAWSQGEYVLAQGELLTAYGLAEDLGLSDEASIATSNLGRAAVHRIVNHFALDEQPEAIRDIALPHFANAYHGLLGHDHMYYRYANAQHGSIAAALAGDRKLVANLVDDGMYAAFRTSERYDQVPTYTINRGGLAQMAAAAIIVAGGHRSDRLMAMTRRKLVR